MCLDASCVQVAHEDIVPSTSAAEWRKATLGGQRWTEQDRARALVMARAKQEDPRRKTGGGYKLPSPTPLWHSFDRSACRPAAPSSLLR